MDLSISLVTPAMQRQRGAAAFKRGDQIDSHGMNPRAPGLKDWTLGFMQAQYDDRIKRNPGIEEATNHLLRGPTGSAQP